MQDLEQVLNKVLDERKMGNGMRGSIEDTRKEVGLLKKAMTILSRSMAALSTRMDGFATRMDGFEEREIARDKQIDRIDSQLQVLLEDKKDAKKFRFHVSVGVVLFCVTAGLSYVMHFMQ